MNNDNTQLGARLGAEQNKFQLSGDMWLKILQALKQRNDMCAQWYQLSKNVSDTAWQHTVYSHESAREGYKLRLQGLQMWTALWESFLTHSVKRIAMGSAAQEAAQNSAIRLWNASTGLNQSATGVLVALSNQGTKTTTQQQDGGNFWGGLLGGVVSSFAGGFGAAYGKGIIGGS